MLWLYTEFSLLFDGLGKSTFILLVKKSWSTSKNFVKRKLDNKAKKPGMELLILMMNTISRFYDIVDFS